jgi:superkiller protein 3
MIPSSFRLFLRAAFGDEMAGGRVLRRRVVRFCSATGVVLVVLLSGMLGSGQTASTPVTGPLLPPNGEVAGLLQQGFDLLARNDAVGAESTFRRVIDLQPESAPAHRGLGLALWAQRDTAAAWRELQVAARLDPSDAGAQLALGKAAWELSFRPEIAQSAGLNFPVAEFRRLALAAMNKAAALRPEDFETRLSLAALLLDAGQPREAAVAAEAAGHLAATPPQRAAARVTLGRAHFALNEIDRAEAEFHAALELDPANGDAYFGLGQVRLSQGNRRQAVEQFRRAIEVAPESPTAYPVLAGTLIEAGQVAEARKLLERAVTLNPADWQSQFRLAKLLDEAGDSQRAEGLYREVAQRQPNFLPVREQLGLNLLRRGDVPGATALAEVLVAKEPQAAEGHRLLALVHWRQRNYEAASAAAALALNAEPDSAAMLALQAIALWQLDRKKDARALLLQAAKVQPHVTTAEFFCRLLLCDARDITLIGDFLRKNRWVVQPYSP